MADFLSFDDILHEFFVEQRYDTYSGGTRRRRSVLLELERDLQYAIGLPKRIRELGLQEVENSKVYTDLPYISPVLIYCSAIDVLARAWHKGRPKKDANGKWFKESAVLFFGYDEHLAKELYNLRNSLTHDYSIKGYVFTRGFSGSELPLASVSNEKDTYIVSTRKCLTSLQKARLKAYDILKNEPVDQKEKTVDYISQHFMFIRT